MIVNEDLKGHHTTTDFKSLKNTTIRNSRISNLVLRAMDTSASKRQTRTRRREGFRLKKKGKYNLNLNFNSEY